MQTTLDLPGPLYEQAKEAALREGMSVGQFVAAAIEQRLHSVRTANGSKQRVQVPLVRSKQPGSLPLTAERVAGLLDDEDAPA